MKNQRSSALIVFLLIALATAANATTSTTTLHIQGMTCAACEIAVKLVLRKTPGVISATVSYEEKRAVVTFDPAKTTPKKIAAAVADALSYTVTVEDDNKTPKARP